MVVDKDINLNNEISSVNKGFQVEYSLSSRQRDCGYRDASHIEVIVLSQFERAVWTLFSSLLVTEEGALLLRSPTDKDLKIRMTRERFSLDIT